MSELFGMQRANGDWFALSHNGDLRMTVFLSAAEAMHARSRNSEMECFRPVALDKHALDALTADDGDTVCFCLVSDPSRKLKRARPIDLAELTSLSARANSRKNRANKT
jgi:hypothetical protein